MIDRDHVRAMVEYEIVWVGDRISAAKSFGKWTCRLCVHEGTISYIPTASTDPVQCRNS